MKTNYAAQGNQAVSEFETLIQDAALSPASTQSREDAGQVAYLARWQAAHPRAASQSMARRLTWLACALVGIMVGVIVAAEILGPHW